MRTNASFKKSSNNKDKIPIALRNNIIITCLKPVTESRSHKCIFFNAVFFFFFFLKWPKFRFRKSSLVTLGEVLSISVLGKRTELHGHYYHCQLRQRNTYLEGRLTGFYGSSSLKIQNKSHLGKNIMKRSASRFPETWEMLASMIEAREYPSLFVFLKIFQKQ